MLNRPRHSTFECNTPIFNDFAGLTQGAVADMSATSDTKRVSHVLDGGPKSCPQNCTDMNDKVL